MVLLAPNVPSACSTLAVSEPSTEQGRVVVEGTSSASCACRGVAIHLPRLRNRSYAANVSHYITTKDRMGVERPPHDGSLLRRAMLMGIGQKLKAECDPPKDFTPELRNILTRLEEQKDNEK